jgi:hypothetical protein
VHQNVNTSVYLEAELEGRVGSLTSKGLSPLSFNDSNASRGQLALEVVVFFHFLTVQFLMLVLLQQQLRLTHF